MCVAAHPDDEDGTTLTVLRRKYGVHTVSLFSTYGEGGQNAVGPELYEELGVIRAQETLKAAKIQGSEPHFLGLKDFGYSKSAEEAFKFWNHDEALRRMVRKIRELRPDVIITNHDTTSGHGHHQATGRLLLEAFTAAADAKSFPEQVGQLGTWQVKRIFVRARRANTEQQPSTADKFVVVDPNEVDPLRGTSFGEQALMGLQQHASQGPWPKTVADWLRAQNNQTGKLNLIRYRLERESPGTPPLPSNPKTFLDGLKLSEATAAMLAPPMIDERPLTEFLDQPDRILDALIIWKRLRPSLQGSSEDAHRFSLISNLRSTALAVAAGVSLNLSSLDGTLVPGTPTRFSVDAANSGNRLVKLDKLNLDAWNENARLEAADQIVPDSETTVAIERTTPKTTAVTVPKAEHLYDGKFRGHSFTAHAEFEIDGAVFSLTKELYLDVVPPVEIKSISPSPCVRTPQAPGYCKSFDVSLVNHLKTPFKAAVSATRASSGTSQNGNQVQLQSLESRTVQVSDLNPNSEPAKSSQESAIELISVMASGSGQPVTQRAVKLSFAAARVTPRLRVGYIPSFDSTIELTLAAMGVESKELTVQEVQQSELESFDTIIIDNRGYEAHSELVPANARLLQFVSNGGNLIVFYHKDNEWNPDEKRNRPQLAPYPILLDDDRVTDETAPIRFLHPSHRLLNYPNRITSTDFNNWIQERGLYYPKEWDPRYTPIFSTSDPGETELTGGLLVANYGKGTYIYTSMVWYRQLRAGIPGAYRMFANMISYGRKVRGR
jgi:LmbE family N-acetylglucosaminyl deacetylase